MLWELWQALQNAPPKGLGCPGENHRGAHTKGHPRMDVDEKGQESLSGLLPRHALPVVGTMAEVNQRARSSGEQKEG